MALSNKRRIFIEEYLKCWNASEAARQAGYKHPGSMGHFLLKIHEIQEAIEERINDLSMSADEVIIRLTNIARNGLKSSRLRSSDVMRALELIGKSHALFTDRVEGRVDLGIDKIVIELKPDGRTEDSRDQATSAA